MNFFFVILGMFIVTYSSRLLPFITLDIQRIPAKMKRFLEAIPYAALGALIFPEVFYAVGENVVAALVGALTAFFAALITRNVVITIVVSVAATSLVIFLS